MINMFQHGGGCCQDDVPCLTFLKPCLLIRKNPWGNEYYDIHDAE